MDHFHYQNSELHAEGVALRSIAEAVDTPFYCYSTATLEHHYRVFTEAFDGVEAEFCYAVKANSNLAVIRTLAQLGAGADVVSEGEMRQALAAGVAPERIVFSGVGKKPAELSAALAEGIGQFNVESTAELETLSALAAGAGLSARIALRLNPDVDAATHAKITTGKAENKFGIGWPEAREIYARAAQLPGLEVVGAAMHIGSQVTQLGPFEEAFGFLVTAVEALRSDGHDIRRLDLGGGLGIPYGQEEPPSPAQYGALVKRLTAPLGCRLVLEPGRVIVGNAGLLVTRVIYLKETASRRFVIVDSAMNDFMRPSLYDARHQVVPVREPREIPALQSVDIVGPICESSDTLARDVPLPPLVTDDLLAIRSAGAYGAVMASTYNGRPQVAEVLVNGNRFAVVRPRQTLAELLATDRLPDWLQADPAKGAA
ncbi:MAG: diaminopimelate decarboxylase [Alphaproteobacteria bacterium]|jgi:diaminopimelate decarboxylase|nr:diaminopimelate decarboxylase [Alphaproteobacteria bacterium]HJP20968.1 diaminopimelate decarboxylase [Alphaproteobacteria bacterium]